MEWKGLKCCCLEEGEAYAAVCKNPRLRLDSGAKTQPHRDGGVRLTNVVWLLGLCCCMRTIRLVVDWKTVLWAE